MFARVVTELYMKGQMKDRTVDIQKLFKNNDHFELFPVRLEDAFDSRWWNKMGGRLSLCTIKADFGCDGKLSHIESFIYLT